MKIASEVAEPIGHAPLAGLNRLSTTRFRRLSA
jgi:hypothetical protein